MKKKIKLTESDLHKIIKESVNQILTELDWRTAVSAANKARTGFRDRTIKDAMGKFDPMGKHSELTGQYGPYSNREAKRSSKGVRWVDRDEETRRRAAQAENLSDFADKAIKYKFGADSYYNNLNGFGKEYPAMRRYYKNKDYDIKDMVDYYPNDEYAHGEYDDYKLTDMPQNFQDKAKEINDFQNGTTKYRKGYGWM